MATDMITEMGGDMTLAMSTKSIVLERLGKCLIRHFDEFRAHGYGVFRRFLNAHLQYMNEEVCIMDGGIETHRGTLVGLDPLGFVMIRVGGGGGVEASQPRRGI
eukprot:GHVO01053379.1.p1 GENE.GHVO01053379.1~~GHVO01053379.1.p1  ORF type:complete len:117 (-),score=20.63 GHVO01053379.1:29-340(-)